jgi:hypothetical protein
MNWLGLSQANPRGRRYLEAEWGFDREFWFSHASWRKRYGEVVGAPDGPLHIGLLIEAARDVAPRSSRVECARSLARVLVRIRTDAIDRPGQVYHVEEVARYLLTHIWRELGEAMFHQEVEPVLAGSWAGDLLTRMQRHYAALVEAERQRQEEILTMRAEKRRLKQERHAERLARKRERDRIWGTPGRDPTITDVSRLGGPPHGPSV